MRRSHANVTLLEDRNKRRKRTKKKKKKERGKKDLQTRQEKKKEQIRYKYIDRKLTTVYQCVQSITAGELQNKQNPSIQAGSR